MTRSSAASVKKQASAPGTGREIKPGVVAFKRARILEEASALFFEKGYEAATLEMLADRLSATKPFLYTYFKGKSAILSAICEVGVKESLAALDRMAETERTSIDLLKASLREVAEIIVARHEYLVVYQREMMNLERTDAQRILRLRHEFDLRIGKLIDDCVRDGDVTVPDAAAMSVWIGGLLSWITYCYRPGSKRSAEMVVDQAVEACLRLIAVA
ncbi:MULTISPECIES: TetR/AcrR family transcriptional regulator [Rhizorhabdus]|jgi:AcrR family transcriptional regulator|uniref:TetR/AcrR family transcriptional regulator n=1 Tax=unclassified Rhizorhabdus TaxID=2617679 RepID=UPI001B64C45E|nr:TetR/AcrR family transcriptional regulator [Rhizorhabdus sp.]MBP8232816.1 TetR family transcriptional regulator [Rhizorhabdus sp.]